MALARQHNLRERLAFVLNDLALNLRLTSQPDLATARAYATEARALWSELDNLPMLADNLNQEALQEYNQAEFALALRYAADADQASQRSDNGWNRAFAAMVRGHVLTAQGEWGAAQTAWHTAIMYGKEAGVFLGETLFPTWLGNLLRDIGQVEAAHALHRAAHAASSATATMLLGEIEAALALDAFALGEIEVGQGWLRSAQQRPLLDRATPAPVYLAHAAVAAAHATGAWEAALALVLEAERATSQRQRPVYTPTLFLWHAQCLAGLGQFDEAESQFALASRTATNLGMWPIAWQAERSLTTLLAAHGRAADAPRERANVIAQRLADTLTAEQRAVFLRHSAAANM